MTPLLLAPLVAAALVLVVARGPLAIDRRRPRGWWRHAVRYRLRPVRLPRDWWVQFERDLAAYVDPGAVRARDRERR